MSSIKDINKKRVRASDGITVEQDYMTLFIDPISGNDNNYGTYGSPWKTLQRGFDYINSISISDSSNVEFVIMGNETTLSIPNTININKNMQIVISPEGKNDAYTLEGSGSQLYMFDIKNCYLKISGATLSYTGTGTYTLIRGLNCNVILSECLIKHPALDVTRSSVFTNATEVDIPYSITTNAPIIKANNSIVEMYYMDIQYCKTMVDLTNSSHLTMSNADATYYFDYYYAIRLTNSIAHISNIDIEGYESAETHIDASQMSFVNVTGCNLTGGTYGLHAAHSTKAYMSDCVMDGFTTCAIRADVDAFIYTDNMTYTNCTQDTSPMAISDTSGNIYYENTGSWIFGSGGGGEG